MLDALQWWVQKQSKKKFEKYIEMNSKWKVCKQTTWRCLNVPCRHEPPWQKRVWRKSRWSLAVTGVNPSKTNSVSLSEDSPTSSRPQAHPPPPRPSGPRWPPPSRRPQPIADWLSRWPTDPQCRRHWRLKRWERGGFCFYHYVYFVCHIVAVMQWFFYSNLGSKFSPFHWLISQIFSQFILYIFCLKFQPMPQETMFTYIWQLMF